MSESRKRAKDMQYVTSLPNTKLIQLDQRLDHQRARFSRRELRASITATAVPLLSIAEIAAIATFSPPLALLVGTYELIPIVVTEAVAVGVYLHAARRYNHTVEEWRQVHVERGRRKL
jgi:hypothetical protein